jgi:hypothetical protein
MIAPSATPHTVYLSSFIDTTNISAITWTDFGNISAVFDKQTGTIDAQKLTPRRVYTVKYTVTSKCGVSSAKAYVMSSTDKVKNNREIYICKDLELSKSVNLNQILGMDSNGTWTYPNDTDGIVEVNVTTSSEKFGKSKIFNAKKAYETAVASGTATYNIAGDPNHKRFKFQYTAADGKVIDFALIVGE